MTPTQIDAYRRLAILQFLADQYELGNTIVSQADIMVMMGVEPQAEDYETSWELTAEFFEKRTQIIEELNSAASPAH